MSGGPASAVFDLERAASWRAALLMGAGLVAVCFASGLDNFFSCDDYHWLFDGLKMIHLPGEHFAPMNNHLRQTEALYFVANLLLGGARPLVYQASALAIHAVNFVLVALLFARLSDRTAALAGALFWALNYRLAEVVLRPYAVADSLALCFGVAAMLLVLRGRPLWAALCFVPALFAKENAIMLGPLAALALVTCRERVWPRIAPLALVSAAWVVLAAILRRDAASGPVIDWRAIPRFWDVVLGYLGPDLDRVSVMLLDGRSPVLPLPAALALSAGLAVLVWRARGPYRFGLVWMIATLLPTVFLPFQASRYTYVPLVGLGLIVGVGGVAWWRRASHTVHRVGVIAAAAVVGTTFFVGIHLEERDWAYLGELHRSASRSFQRDVLPSLLASPETTVVFVKDDSRVWIERAYEEMLAAPWYLPVTFKRLLVRPDDVLGMSDTAAFVTACAIGRTPTPLFVRVSRAELDRRLEAGDFVAVVHDRDNRFSIGSVQVRDRIRSAAGRSGLYDHLRPGRFDPTFRGGLSE